MRLLGNRIHLRPLKKPEVTPSGIHLLSHLNDDFTQFQVLGVGPGRKLKNGSVVPIEFNAGDFVFCPLWRDSLHVFDNGDLIVDASQVQAKWEQ